MPNIRSAHARANERHVIRRAQRGGTGLRASLSEQLVFYADLVNSDRYLPASMVGNVIREAMLAKGLVTTQQLRMRGVL